MENSLLKRSALLGFVALSLVLILSSGGQVACSLLATPTPTATNTPTATPTHTPTNTPTSTPTPTATPTATLITLLFDGPTKTPPHADNRGECLECHVAEELVAASPTP